ncbi:MAG: non-ribosomal peptide synthetase [Terriglobales bacterium]
MSSRAELACALLEGPPREEGAGARSLGQGPRVLYARDTAIAQLFEQQAARTPQAPAVIAAGRTLTYRELDARTNRLARCLRACGVMPETCVGVAIERSPEMLIAQLAILKAGGAYVPLDPAYPAARVRFIANDAAVPVVLATARTRALLAGVSARILDVEEEVAAIGAQSCQPLAPRARGRHLAYLMYTSGSTGEPKGVMIEHRNVLNLFAGMDRLLGPGPGVWLAVTSMAFDISVLELFWTLTRGFTVVLHAGPGTQGIGEEMRQYGVTHFQSTPALARLLALDVRALAALGGLKALLLGGEALPVALLDRLREFVRGDIFNMYGPTETTVWSTAHRAGREGGRVPIGKPLANTQVYVLDAAGRRVAPGAAGELYIGGDGVGRGYWRRAALSGERFRPDPFRDRVIAPGANAAAPARLYRTGDLARFLPDGSLEFLGRTDAQLKLRGVRIEPGEIEAALESHPGVQQALVVAREDKPGDQQLVAYLLPRGEPPQADELRGLLAATLPEPMVPARFVVLPQFPLTANGKIDRAALPPPVAEFAGFAADPAAAVPRLETSVEQGIAETWCEALGVREIAWDANFFDLGAHSLMVAEVHMRLQQRLGHDFPLLDLFQFPTVALLGKHRRQAMDPGATAAREEAPAVADRTAAARRRAWRAARADADEQEPA